MRSWQMIRDRAADLLALPILVAAPIESVVRAHTALTPLTMTAVSAGILLLGRRRFPLLAGAGALAIVTAGAAAGGAAPFGTGTPLFVAPLPARTARCPPPPLGARNHGAPGRGR